MQIPTTTQRNIGTICAIETEALARRSLSARLGDAIAIGAGRMWFIVIHVIWFTVWIWINSPLSGKPSFDPFPFPLLTLVVSLEAIFLSLFILMSQNRSNAHAEQRNHLDLQINLLAEHENTKMIQMLQALCEHHGLAIGKDLEIAELAKKTEPGEVFEELKTNLPAG